tara:strand:+ start:2031 stop:2870 length:840 start_codon:yes stop_codon:yes gene_type:complete
MNIGIVGLGLIGGSIGLKLQSLDHTVFGVTNNGLNNEKAKKRKLANIISEDYKVLQNCNLVILALPINDLVNPSPDLINAIPKKSIVTDVGSVKSPIIETWEKIHPLFIGSHPMAGNEKKGVEAGNEALFDNAKWVITPTSKTNKDSLKILSNLLKEMGCRVYFESPDIHDEAVAIISHLPIYLGSCLIETANCDNNQELLNLSRKLASTGFADTTRVGGGNPSLGLDLATHNRKNIINWLKIFKENIHAFEEIFENNNWNLLHEKLENSKKWRDDFCN